jgi:membrane protein required for colicin V production
MNTIDIILSLLLLTGIVRGFIQGFIYEIAVLGVLFVSYFLGFKLADIAAVYIGKVLSVDRHTLHYISLLTVWIGISVGIFFLVRLFEGLINIAALGIFNKIAGAIFGGMKYAVVLSLLMYFINRFEISTSWFNTDTRAESTLYYPLLKISTALFSSL